MPRVEDAESAGALGRSTGGGTVSKCRPRCSGRRPLAIVGLMSPSPLVLSRSASSSESPSARRWLLVGAHKDVPPARLLARFLPFAAGLAGAAADIRLSRFPMSANTELSDAMEVLKDTLQVHL